MGSEGYSAQRLGVESVSFEAWWKTINLDQQF